MVGSYIATMACAVILIFTKKPFVILFAMIAVLLWGLAQKDSHKASEYYSLLLLAGLITISTVAFILYNTLLRYNNVADIAIFNALIPVSGTVLSCLLLDEKFYMKYLVAVVVIVFGIWLTNGNQT